MEPWTGAQRAFAVKAFYKNGDNFVIAQREFRREFGIHRIRAVPSAHAIKTFFCRDGSEDLCVKSLESWLQTARMTQSGGVQNSVDFFQWPLSPPQYSGVYVLFLHYHLFYLV
jgi:hypothetical protein